MDEDVDYFDMRGRFKVAEKRKRDKNVEDDSDSDSSSVSSKTILRVHVLTIPGSDDNIREYAPRKPTYTITSSKVILIAVLPGSPLLPPRNADPSSPSPQTTKKKTENQNPNPSPTALAAPTVSHPHPSSPKKRFNKPSPSSKTT